MRGVFRKANLLILFSPLLLVPVFVVGGFMLTRGGSFNAYRYEAAAETDPGLPKARGVYVDTPRGFLWLLPFAEPLAEPPSELIPRVATEDARAVVVYRRALDPPERYKMFDLSSGNEIALERERVGDAPALRLRPAAGGWEAGPYGISVPQEGLAAGNDWYYLVVE